MLRVRCSSRTSSWKPSRPECDAAAPQVAITLVRPSVQVRSLQVELLQALSSFGVSVRRDKFVPLPQAVGSRFLRGARKVVPAEEGLSIDGISLDDLKVR